MAKAGGKRGPRPPAKSSREKDVQNDVFEAEDSDPEEDRLKNKYDRVDNYEYEMPSDFEDEEIDEDAAFTAEDEALYGHLFDNGPRAEGSEDEEEDEDEAEEGSDGSAADIALDSEEEEEEEQGSERSEDELDGVFESSEDGGGSSDEEEAGEGKEGDSEDEEETAAHASLLAAVTGGAAAKTGKKARRATVTEAYPEAEHNMPNAGDLSVGDLLQGLGTSQARLGKARKALVRMEAKEAAVAPPLPGLIRKRLERKAGYEDASKDVAKWTAMVKANREAPTLRFVGDRSASAQTTTTASLVDRHVPETAMEAEVAAMLARAGAHSDKALAEAEEALAARDLSIEEVRERQHRLAKMRALLYYHEAKSKRLKKIKSKEYRRQIKRADKRKAAKLEGEEGEGGAGDAAAAAEEAEFERAKERLTLKHRNTSRWARRALKRGVALTDDATRAALAEQLQLGQELRRKIERVERDSDDDSSTSASDDEGAAPRASRLRRAAEDILQDEGGEAAAAPQGLLALPFMRRAMDKRRAAAVQAAQGVLDAEAGVTPVAGSSGRLAFGGGGLAPPPRAAAPPTPDSDLESDENEDVEAKTERLARHLQRQRGEEEEVEEEAGRSAQAAFPSGTPTRVPTPGTPPRTAGSTPKHHASAGFVAAAGAAPRNGKKRALPAQQPAAEHDGLWEPRPAAAAAETPAPFVPAKTFAGARPGYTFKKGISGVGYYVDAVAAVAAGASQQAKQQQGRPKKIAKTVPGKGKDAAALNAQDSDSMQPVKGASALTQDDLIRMAFAGDDVAAEFATEKAGEVEGELPKLEEIGVLPGWGAWAGSQREPAWMAETRRKGEAKRAATAAARKDAKLQYVILSEKYDKAASKYRTATVPFPYDSKETYERARRQPLGRDYNTDAAFRDLTRPALLKDAGVIIQPLRYSAGAAEAAAEAPRRAARNATTTVAAGRPARGRAAPKS